MTNLVVMPRFLLTLLLATSSFISKADMGPPSVQAICKVKTADGKTYEGFVTLIVGTIDSQHANGFYIDDGRSGYETFFNFDLKRWEKKESPSTSFLSYAPDYKQGATYWLTESTKTTREDGSKYLTRERVIHRRYLMLDTLPLFTELPKYLHLDYKNRKEKHYKIPVKEIVSFEIVFLQLDPDLMAEIKKKTIACEKEVNDPNSTGDFNMPLWVHELVKDPELMRQTREGFEQGLRN